MDTAATLGAANGLANLPCADAGLREIALFAGAGGGILGGKLLGWRTVCAVEFEPYAASVLAQRQNDGLLAPFPIWDDVRTFDGRPWAGRVDVVAGGFPCQDISAAGKGAGITGERSGLWVEMARIIGEVQPRYAFVENSPMLTVRGLGVVLGDLAAMGYDARWGVLGAADVGAPHKRERIWILANARRGRLGRKDRRQDQQPWRAEAIGASQDVANASSDVMEGRNSRQWVWNEPERRCDDVANPRRCEGKQRHDADVLGRRQGEAEQTVVGGGGCHADRPGLEIRQGQPGDDGRQQSPAIGTGWWATEPDVGRVAHGVAARMDRLKAIGNGQVPQCAALAWQILRG